MEGKDDRAVRIVTACAPIAGPNARDPHPDLFGIGSQMTGCYAENMSYRSVNEAAVGAEVPLELLLDVDESVTGSVLNLLSLVTGFGLNSVNPANLALFGRIPEACEVFSEDPIVV
ncbi:hypothetical protein HDU96_010858 [Phlyctochytrium bullatum]|nr:hypothetical protein HDU96_010858 [Phlyctochytrium bullatum]